MITIGVLTLSTEVFWTWIIIISFTLYRLGVFLDRYSIPLRKKNLVEEPTQCPVSIIIPARNCAEELRENLPLYLNQDYPNFEVIIVDQCSNDDTQKVVSHLKESYPNLKITGYTQEVNFTRKLNFFLGLKASSHEWAIFVSPYTQPENNKWLYNLSAGMQPDKDLVFLREERERNNSIIDHLAKAQLYFRDLKQSTHITSPIIYHAENIAFRKKKIIDFFMSNNPCYPYPMVENLMNKAASELKASYHSTLITYDKQPLKWRDLINIRENHLFIRKNLRTRLRIHLCFEELSRTILLVAFIIGLTLESGKMFIPGVVVLLILTKSWFFYKIKGAFNFREFLIIHIYDFSAIFTGVFLRSRMQIQKQREKWT